MHTCHTHYTHPLTTESLDDHPSDGAPLVQRHLLAHPKKHQHVVTVTHPSGIEVTEDICTRYLPLQEHKGERGEMEGGEVRTTIMWPSL